MWKPDLCIYHGNCDDGFTAAWAIWKRWPDCEFVPATYGKPLPSMDGRHVLFVDFSAPYDVLSAASWRARSIAVIDHHKTAEADLARLLQFSGDVQSLEEAFFICKTENHPDIASWFDMSRSGAKMAWEFAHPATEPPRMVDFVEDRDLWRFAFGDVTKRYSAALRTETKTFENWNKISLETERLIVDGIAILKSHSANIEKFLEETYAETIGGFVVPVVNVPYHYASDVAHAMLERNPLAPFTACWFQRGDGMIQYSLRSEDKREDVSAIAKQFGGGGHRNAAGFQVRAR